MADDTGKVVISRWAIGLLVVVGIAALGTGAEVALEAGSVLTTVKAVATRFDRVSREVREDHDTIAAQGARFDVMAQRIKDFIASRSLGSPEVGGADAGSPHQAAH